MRISFPKYFEAILKKYVKQTFYASTKREAFAEKEFNAQDLKFFAEGAKNLSGLFTSERNELVANYLNEKSLRAGYLLYFLPLNFCKAQAVLERLPRSFFKKSKIKILDLGSGPGTFSLGLIDYLTRRDGASKTEKHEIHLLSLDQNYHIVRDAQALHEEMVKNLKAKGYNLRLAHQARTFDLRRGKPDTLLKNDQYDLIIVSNFLNEWKSSSSEEKVRFLEKIYQRHLSPDGYLIVVEPALQKSARDLMELRDQVLHRKSLHVYAPCLHAKPCPMLVATQRDWCHFYTEWEKPDFIGSLDKVLKNDNQFLKYAYMIFSPKAGNEVDSLPVKKDKAHLYRTVSNLMGSKGRSEVVVCGPSGRWRLARQDKHDSRANQAFETLKRGDLVMVPLIPIRGFNNEGDIKIEPDDRVDKV